MTHKEYEHVHNCTRTIKKTGKNEHRPQKAKQECSPLHFSAGSMIAMHFIPMYYSVFPIVYLLISPLQALLKKDKSRGK